MPCAFARHRKFCRMRPAKPLDVRPGDPVLNVTATDVAVTGIYQGRRRMTLSYPAINRARRILCRSRGRR
jgi:hypothetical protein